MRTLDKVFVAVVLILLIVLFASLAFADNSERIKELQFKRLALVQDILTYKAQTEANLEVNKAELKMVDGAIRELIAQDKRIKEEAKKKKEKEKKDVE